MHIQDSHGQVAVPASTEAVARLSTPGALAVVESSRPAGGAGSGLGRALGAVAPNAPAAPAVGSAAGPAAGSTAVSSTGAAVRSAPLRVDAQRNLEHVLRAAREVFGELGYGAPMEDVARRARVGVGTVYRRFPSKDVLVRRIAEAETARLTEQARAALGQEDEAWSALSRFLRTSVASGAGRLLPPQVLRVETSPRGEDTVRTAGDGADGTRVPQQRQNAAATDLRQTPQRPAGQEDEESSGTGELLEVVGRLVERARESGELRTDVTVADVLLVIATSAPSLPDPAQQAAASARLLDILLEGLRSRPA
ncbi:TetR/AcrR family transcriptional regulator [Streptomyces sp. NBC_00102]|uniref:TetR/AcrR family transcriptional regulator n=1 Tax=Streptomyces sp. NBC_00102 TaxID=2975652 RepID=UPI0022551E07|nr:helix-turn-helix domain-containing protein [Streptomyces sp. NBC_00102]MCX5398042.1 TetR/AcrR family transcriptional regulator [Streptomyces sp. NBC_00102]